MSADAFAGRFARRGRDGWTLRRVIAACAEGGLPDALSVRCESVVIEDETHVGVYRSSDWAERCFANGAFVAVLSSG